ncbi:MAG: family 10 glycosylhydrolase [Prevotella sp.]|jgi:uncharacterized lipoprotein YddW (UPF0748 family)|nr:family 10 glycosylhydrolase [Prevotella sp.]
MKKYLKYLIILSLLAFVTSCEKDDTDGIIVIPSEPVDPPTDELLLSRKELRGVWIATVSGIDWPQNDYTVAGQKRMYTDYLDKFADANINAVFVQIRPTADAFYNSAYESWSRSITGVAGKDPGYDVLQFMLDEAHARGLEFHAWMNPYRISQRSSSAVAFPDLDPKINQAWTKDYDKIRVYNPAMPEVHQHVADIVKDVITKYDVDGIHFDDYFYPDLGNVSLLNDQADYNTYGSGYANITQFRIANVNKAIRKVMETIVKEKPGVVFSISPTSSYNYNLNTLFADVATWCKEGWCDIVIPQIYQATGSASNNFDAFVDWWATNNYKAVPMVGYALYKFGDSSQGDKFMSTEELVQQFGLANARTNIKGSVLYNATCFNTNRIGIIDVLKSRIYKNPALIPFVGRKTLSEPTVVSVMISGNKLMWNAPANLRFAIYKLENDRGTIVGITGEQEFDLTDKGDYCVTVVNKDNVESAVSNIISYQ